MWHHEDCSFQFLTFTFICAYAMWPSAWSNSPFTGCPPCQNPGNPYGSHPGALPGGGGCNPAVQAMGPPSPQCHPTGPWTHPGQGGWHPQNLMPHGIGPGGHHQGLPPHTLPQSSHSVSHPQGALHNIHPQAFPSAPHMAFQPPQHGLHHTPSLPAQQGTSPYQEGQPTSGTTPHQGSGTTTENTTNPPSSTSSLTITQLEQRLEEVMDKKLESMTKALRSSMAPVAEPQPATSPTIQDRGLASGLQQTQEVHLPQDSSAHTLVHRTSTGQEAQQHDMLTSKAKPPIRPEETTSRRRSTRGRSRDHVESPSHSGRQPLPRHRGRSYQSQREDQYIPTSRSYTPPGHRERSGPHDRLGRRDELPDWASMSTSQGERNLSHPIYQRSNAIRARSSNAESWHQIHADANTTVFARSSGDSYHRESRHQQDRQTPSITLRSRSRSRRSRAPQRAHYVYHGKGAGIHLHPRPHHHHGSTRHDSSYREPSQSEAESAQVAIPPPDAVEQPDWGRSSQERERPAAEAPEEDDQLIAIPKTQSLDADWKMSVEKAFNDITRTKAPCEISADLTCKLISTVSKRQFENFVKILQDRNPTAPREVVGNIATIFAQSGKLDMKQAEGSSTFEVPQSLGYGLFVPTYFKTKPPFQNNDSNVYHILHGTTNKGASLILAEELIRPGDFTIHKNPAKCGYPSYGYYSAGEVAAKTVPFSSNIKELSRKILKIGKGTLPVFIGGIYMGRNPHINQNSGGNDEIQRLCGEHGAARGKEKYLVARSEHTTVHGVVITYKNAIEVQTTRP